MMIRNKKIISILILTFCFCLVMGVGYTGARYSGIFDAGEFFLSLTLGGGGEVEPGEAYTLVYHTFDETGADVVYKTEIVYENLPVTIEAAPEAHSDLTFVGWSPTGTWMSDEDATYEKVYDVEPTDPIARILYTAGQQVEAAANMLFTKVSSTEIHLYDLYSEYVVTVEGLSSNYWISCDFYVGNGSKDLFVIHYGSRESAGYSSTVLSYYVYAIEGKIHTHYVHPSMSVKGRTSFHYDTDSQQDKNGNYQYKIESQVKKNNGSWSMTQSWTQGLESVALYTRCVQTTNSDYKESSSCIAAGTLITMADGSRRPVEEVRTGDIVRVFDHESGGYTTSPILFIEYDGDMEWNVINLEFSDGTIQEFIGEHAIFDLTLNKYVYITPENCKDFIGHRFAKEESVGYSETVLTNAYTQIEFTGCYGLTTEYHMNFFVNGMFSIEGGITGLFNFFEYDEKLAYDRALMAQDIETYGLFTYDDFAPYMSEETFNSIFPIKYLKVSVGKGLTTFEGLEYIIERYIYRHGLD